MDSSYSDAGDGPDRLSLSLISYDSDIEDIDEIAGASTPSFSSDTLIPDSRVDQTEKESIFLPSSTDEDELVKSVVTQLSLSGVSPEKLDKLSNAVEKMEKSHEKYMWFKLLLDAVNKVAEESVKLPPQTAQRLTSALEHISLLDCVSPTDPERTEGIFGISQEHLSEHFPNELTVLDIKHLKNVIEVEISKTHSVLAQLSRRSSDILDKASGPVLNKVGNHAEKGSTHELISLCKSLDHEIAVNEAYLEDLDKILSALVKLKLENFDHIYSSKIEHLESQCKTLKNDIRSLNEQVVDEIYYEDQHLIDAHTTLKKNLDFAIAEAKLKLSELEKKEADYEKLRGTQFDRLVRDYNNLMGQIAQKEYALKNLM